VLAKNFFDLDQGAAEKKLRILILRMTRGNCAFGLDQVEGPAWLIGEYHC
jgi:hypothetical protein